MPCNQWAPWDGWFHAVELTQAWLCYASEFLGGWGIAAQCLTEMHGQCNIQLESSSLARSILWKRVKALVPLAVFSKIQTEVLRQAEGLQGPKFLETWFYHKGIHDSEANRKMVPVLSW